MSESFVLSNTEPNFGEQVSVSIGHFTQYNAYSYQCKAGSVLIPKNSIAYRHIQGSVFNPVDLIKPIDGSSCFCLLYVYINEGSWNYGKCTYIGSQWQVSYSTGVCSASSDVRVSTGSDGITVSWDEFYTSGWSGGTGTREYTWVSILQ